MTFKLLDVGGRGVLENMLPALVDHSKGKKRGRDTRGAAAGLQIQSRSGVYSLDAFKRSYLGSIHHIWAKLPQSLVREGEKRGWSKVTKRSKLHLMGKQPKQKSSDKRQKIAKQKVRVTDNVNDGFDIGGFKANRVCEFEVDIKDYDMSLKIKVNPIYKKLKYLRNGPMIRWTWASSTATSCMSPCATSHGAAVGGAIGAGDPSPYGFNLKSSPSFNKYVVSLSSFGSNMISRVPES